MVLTTNVKIKTLNDFKSGKLNQNIF